MTKKQSLKHQDLLDKLLIPTKYGQVHKHYRKMVLDNGIEVSVRQCPQKEGVYQREGLVFKHVFKPVYGNNVQFKRDGVLIGIIGYGSSHSMAWFRKDGVSRADRAFLGQVIRANKITPGLCRKKTDEFGTMIEQRIRQDGGAWRRVPQNKELAKITSGLTAREMGHSTAIGSPYDLARRHVYLNGFFKVAK